MSRGEWAEMHGPGETRLMKLPRVPVIRGQWSHHIMRIKLGDTAKILGKMVKNQKLKIIIGVSIIMENWLN